MQSRNFGVNQPQNLLNRIWMISDCHFFHGNIIKYCNRPYSSISEMNEQLIINWNSIVKETDEIFILGDFAFNSIPVHLSETILSQLKGIKHLIRGNHDRKELSKSIYFKSTSDILEVKINHQAFILSHYPLDSWHNQFYGTYHFHGHIHSHPKNFNYTRHRSRRLDIGVDNNNYFPININQCIEKLDQYDQFAAQNSIMSIF